MLSFHSLSHPTMLDLLRQGLSVHRHQLCSCNPTYEGTNVQDAIRTTGPGKDREHEAFEDGELEFQVPIEDEDGFGAHSPPLWKTSISSQNEDYPVLLQNQKLNNHSPTSGMQAILNGRRELLEMIQKMPESSYDLSLKDMVDQEAQQEAKEEAVLEKPDLTMEEEKNRTRKLKGRRLLRCKSMESNRTLLNMFLPQSLIVNKKPATKKLSEVYSRSSSFEKSMGHIEKECCTNKQTITGEINDDETCRTCRHNNSSTSPGCWQFIHAKKSNTWRQCGCPF